MNPLAEPLSRSPELFPHGLDLATDSLTLLRLTEEDYAKASFLDGRLPAGMNRKTAFAEVAAAVAELPEKCDFIFHIGHVGSTLVSRLLGRHPGVFALREPAVLRTLAQIRAEPERNRWSPEDFETHLSTLLRLLSRTFRADQRAMVKMTSFVSELAPEILARPYRPKAIFMTVPPESYLATILGAENSPKEAQMLADLRARRLQRRIGGALEPVKSMGELVAMSWASEMCALAAALPQSRERILWLNFDRFLIDPAKALSDCFHHLGIEARAERVGEILSGPDMRRYSKAQEYDYDPQLRADVLAQAHALHGADIADGLRWLETMGAKHPLIAAAAGLAQVS